MGIDILLKDQALLNGWRFSHARRDYQNLIAATQFVQDELEGLDVNETVLFLDPVTQKNVADGKIYSGNFMVLTVSDLDMSHEDKRENYIKPLKLVIDKMYSMFKGCYFDVNDWTVIEVINVFDFNGDGVNVRFNVKEYN